jgi:predicted metal-dependent hydrolase
MPTIEDKEFGRITVRRSALAHSVKIRVAANGTLSASLPMYAPMFMIKRLIQSSREELRELLSQQQPTMTITDGMMVGKSHKLSVYGTPTSKLAVKRHGQVISVYMPADYSLASPEVVAAVRREMQAALRIEAKNYLPRRLNYLADELGYTYDKVRFSHASGRWGSCSSNGTVSLNIALMKLPHELIDYVLVHELSHTREMNHSAAFWQLVAQGDPHYKLHRRELKRHSPSV